MRFCMSEVYQEIREILIEFTGERNMMETTDRLNQ